jgi:hypothetical protein
MLTERYKGGRDFSVVEIKKFIARYSAYVHRPLYIHTDDHATHHYDPRVRFDEGAFGQMANIGCGYFKACIYMPDKIQAQEQESLQRIAKKVYQAFCELASENPKIVACVELKGAHKEDDVLIVSNSTKADPDGHVFVYHPEHEYVVGSQMFDVLETEIEKERLLKRFRKICEEHWNGAINLLAPGVPHRRIG